jgi:beta-glucosidase
MTNYSMYERTYRYSTATPLFSFGYGLSYSKFAYSGLTLSSTTINAGENLTLSVNVTNLGPYSGDEVTFPLILFFTQIKIYNLKVVQVYIQMYLSLNFTVPHPQISLVAYERINLDVNQQTTLTFKVTPEQLSVYYPDDSIFTVFPSKISSYF